MGRIKNEPDEIIESITTARETYELKYVKILGKFK